MQTQIYYVRKLGKTGFRDKNALLFLRVLFAPPMRVPGLFLSIHIPWALECRTWDSADLAFWHLTRVFGEEIAAHQPGDCLPLLWVSVWHGAVLQEEAAAVLQRQVGSPCCLASTVRLLHRRQ